jgi:hypothetical protein
MTQKPVLISPLNSRRVGIWEKFLVLLTALLFGLRYFQPTENADAGETLWITCGWLLLISGCSILYAIKKINFDHIHRTPWDIAISLLCGGHILSGLLVYFTQGNKFYAINLSFEWLGLWATWKLLRISCHISGVKQALFSGFMGIIISLTILGLYQYWIFYPDLRSEVQPLFEEYNKLSAQQMPTPKMTDRLRKIKNQFNILGLPEDKSERDVLAQRMFFSTEIFGYFALANTFAGVLVVASIFSNFTTRGMIALGSIYNYSPGVIAQLLLLYGIYLTKSRTAIVAWVVTTSIYLLYIIWIKPPRVTTENSRPNYLQLGMIIAGFICLLGLMFASFNQLDQKVISEAPKSLQYRLEYWTGTWQIIKEHPLVGCGLGQFRPAYLEHKLLGSSEEVKDPHQLFLDVWVNGGIIALAGIIMLGILLLQELSGLNRYVPALPEGNQSISTNRYNAGLVYVGLGLSFITSYMYHLYLNESLSEFIFLLLVCYALWSFLSSKFVIDEMHLIQAGVLAVIALLIHLQAAGGIGMPAIVQTLFLGICCLLPINQKTPLQADSEHQITPAYHRYLAPVVPVLCTLLCWQYAFVPFLLSREYFNLAAGARDSRYREAYLLSAIKASPHQPEYTLAYANLILEKLKQKQATLEQFLQTLEAVVKTDPLNPRSYRQAGTWCDQLYILWKSQAPESQAVQLLAEKTGSYYARAQNLYPFDGKFISQYAIFLHETSQTSQCKDISQLALKIHQTNLANGHVDKILPINTVQQLESYVK